MSGSTGTTQRFAAKGYELHVSSDGIALASDGRVPSDPDYQAAGLDEIAGAHLDRHARRLTISFLTGRPVWTLSGMKEPEASWAESLVNEAVERERLYRDSCFSERLTG